jgi:hypothetical protein
MGGSTERVCTLAGRQAADVHECPQLWIVIGRPHVIRGYSHVLEDEGAEVEQVIGAIRAEGGSQGGVQSQVCGSGECGPYVNLWCWHRGGT